MEIVRCFTLLQSREDMNDAVTLMSSTFPLSASLEYRPSVCCPSTCPRRTGSPKSQGPPKVSFSFWEFFLATDAYGLLLGA